MSGYEPKLFRLMLILILSCAGYVSAETTDCTAITSLPAVITSQGVYCFTGNLTTASLTGNAIEIQTNNVTIDMNGFKLGGQAAGLTTSARGFYAYQRKNITIRNGVIRGFFSGILLDDEYPYSTSKGHLVEDILADANTFVGIQVEGAGVRVRNNQIVDTGGNVFAGTALGIFTRGPSASVTNNQVSHTAAGTSGSSTNDAFGIILRGADGSVVSRNRVSDTYDVDGNGYGIVIRESDYVVVRDNVVASADYGIYYLTSTGKYMGNLTENIGTAAFTGGTPVGTNN